MKNQNPRTLVQHSFHKKTAAFIITKEEKNDPKLQVPTLSNIMLGNSWLIWLMLFHLIFKWWIYIACISHRKGLKLIKVLKMCKIMQLESNPGFRQNQDSHLVLADSEMKAFWCLLCNMCIFDISFIKIKKKLDKLLSST